MPSRLSRGFGRRARELRSTGQQLAPATIPIQSPWRGYQPDLVANEREATALSGTQSIIVKGGWLTLDAGWVQLNAANLPLGRDDETIGYTIGATNYGAGDLTTSAANAQPVVAIVNFPRVNRVNGLFTTEVLAITAVSGGAAGTHTESGHLFRKKDTGDWAAIEYDSTDGDTAGGPAEVASSKPMLGTIDELPDVAVYSPGIAGVSMNAGADLIVEVPEAVVIWCNGPQGDEIMYYPDDDSSSGATDENYTDFLSYETQVDGAAAGATVYGNRPDWVSMKAQSCESWDNRMFYLNVSMDSVIYSTRLAWSIVGNPFIVDPSVEADDGTNLFTGTGAGWIELEQFSTEGLRVEEMGDALAVYTKDGVALVRRKSSIITDPYIETYLTKDRGLISTHALANLGGGSHFGIFNDGWWLVTQQGFKEVGRIGDESSLSRAFSREVEQRILYKWKSDFYRRLNQEKIHLTTTSYDPINRIVRISVAMDGSPTPNEVWIYEIESDRAFLDDYSNVGASDQSPYCWGGIIRTAEDAEAWNDFVGQTWASLSPQTWASFGARYADRAVAHGDANGYVFIHDDEEDRRDGNQVNWNLTTAPHHAGALSTIKAIDAFWVEYENRSAQITNINVIMASEENFEVRNVSISEGALGSIQVAKAHYRHAGHHYQLNLSGRGKPMLGAMSLRVLVDRPEPGIEAIGGE